MSGDEVSELRIEGDLAGLGEVQERELVHYVRQPLTFSLVGQIGPPKGVVDRLLAHGGFCGEGHFGEVHHGGSG